MVQTRRGKKAASEIKLAYPDLSGPSEKTLLQFAQERNLFKEAERKEKRNKRRENLSEDDDSGDEDGDDEDEGEEEELLSPTADKILDAILWSVSLAMLHFTLDVLVQHQYAMYIIWPQIITRAMQAFAVFLLLVYVLHPHASSPAFVPGLPLRFQAPLRQAIFFTASIVAGCYLIHISNKYGYIAVMKRSPPLGCIWVWSVIELNLTLSVLSLACALGFFVQGGYTIRAPY
ncbi:uncharacterized protein GGS25DRAFT_478817 [Hypoxylon fragiforme]|uniref:uncharacterized protein n=1 Tax=Hypoxylon fragiforme TaxID=63214 RepID=UPI0020C68F9F|nr:uncharacterized protein GGS25DRAFT_478817 [Hypoxylon fragiforme]KAI2613176.1 hypothetical protein GGS25DRAFT_478817 [Hypoxylon fragiforme]